MSMTEQIQKVVTGSEQELGSLSIELDQIIGQENLSREEKAIAILEIYDDAFAMREADLDSRIEGGFDTPLTSR